ncbi:hypothetical protein EDD16DRAFT_1709249 [Pisolithus croceorrhizus]|nr:hypothetical protein EV401DRAFT_2079726 [Pisolithus croceorrhizus]KAI6114599.1 hypothetical protein EDD16DRAFT_1709249 [Pisolithus croceorrhizus]
MGQKRLSGLVFHAKQYSLINSGLCLWTLLSPSHIIFPLHVSLQMMVSNPDERWSSTLEQSMEVDSFTEADNTSTLSTDDYIQVQQVTLPPASKETCTDDNLFLSRPDGQLFCGTTPAVTNRLPGPSKETPQQWLVNVSALRVSMEEPAVKCLGSLSGGAGSCSSVPLLHWDTKPGLALSALLDKLGFEPAGYPVITPPPVTKTIPSIKNFPLMLKPPSHADSPSPSRTPSGSLIISQDFFNIKETDISNDKGDQVSVVGCIPNSVLAVLMERFNEINEMFSKLAAHVKMPFHQVSDCYICLHSHTHGMHLWNMYSMYFAKNMECELACLPKGEQITGTPTADIQKHCFSLFKVEYKDTYLIETWKEAKELENMGGTLAQWQQVFDKSKKNLNHTAHRICVPDALLIDVFLVHCAEQSPWVQRCLSPGWMSGQSRQWTWACIHNPWHREALEFFATHCHTGDNEIIGHFKAHIYNMVSLQAVDKVFKAPKMDGVDDKVEVVSDTRDRLTWDGSEETEDHAQVKLHLHGLFKECGWMWGSDKLFPWKLMLHHLVSSELVLVNWPEGVMFPGEEHASHTMPKGISDLT